MKLNDYIENERIRQVESQIDSQNQSLSLEYAIMDFEKSFKNLVANGFIRELQTLSEKSNDFDFKILEKEIAEYPYKYYCEFDIWVELQPAQYYLHIKADPEEGLNSIQITVESSGYQRKLDERELKFETLEKLSFEEYLIELVQEFRKYD